MELNVLQLSPMAIKQRIANCILYDLACAVSMLESCIFKNTVKDSLINIT